MVKIDTLTSRRLTMFSFLAACLVTLLHCPVPWTSTIWAVGYRMFVRFGFCEIAVPYFFIVAGFFVAGKYMTGAGLGSVWKTEVMKRVRSLLVPYFVFCLIAFVLKGNIARGTDLTVLSIGLGLNFFQFPEYKLLWFVRNLFLLVLISPLLILLLGRSKRLAIAVTAMLAIVYVISRHIPMGEFFTITFRWRSLFYFSLGIVIRMWCGQVWYKPMFGWCFLMVGLGMLWVENQQGRIFPGIEVAHEICLLAGVWGCVPDWRFPNWMLRNAFPIYLLHGIILFGYRIVRMRLSYSGDQFVLESLIVFLFVVLLSLSLAN